MSQTIGVLSIQGAFEKHRIAFEKLGLKVLYVRSIAELEKIDKLVIPGGESTAMVTILKKHDLWFPLKKFCSEKPVFGTCAGAILLAKKTHGLEKFGVDNSFSVMDIEVKRNSYGRQLDSFKTFLDIKINNNSKKIESIFIRAPSIMDVDSAKVEILASFKKEPVFVRQGNKLAVTFHPELTDDLSIHQYFADI
ncbi:MAG TPA: pyridoxal 5'-phosphate synthase glutaminase subunit PdxT [Lentisphaeria bacterium]|nr:MAG: glutamine amidotransferase subunit PdxT [Lentisphaerae bacterium GWF2_38_69]HBM17202.1 pyridoxal 5'-phosphate synthase glutaminase subunit PdxT [Lentisphaeria bacterium]